MKSIIIFGLTMILLVAFPNASEAQFDLGKKIKKHSQKALDKASDKAADKGIDEAEKGIDNIYEDGDAKTQESKQDTPDNNGVKQNSDNMNASTKQSETSQEDDALRAYSKYNFVPGDIVIFEDNLENEENGEFPSKWDLKTGNVEIARYGSEKVINFPDVNWGKIVPLMAETGDYLPEKFTIEFDAYFSEFCTRYVITLYDMVNQQTISGIPEITVSPNGASVGTYGTTNINTDKSAYPFWQRIAVQFNVRSLKVFYGETRTHNIPNFKFNPTGITLSGSQCHGDYQAMIKNIRIATGQMKLYDRVVTDGRFATNGIRFDVGKASIRPESMGVINQVFNMMLDHPELRFTVVGHTDSDGDEGMNLTLSEERAKAVVKKLVSMGIEDDRFQSEGLGESQPIDSNTTPEGKANNRRVEFIKI
jgi:outer membrane protein OmpA-like peptidoglycan-associated protein